MLSLPWGSMSARQRKYEIERMEACDVPRKSRNRDLQAAFREAQSEGTEPTVAFTVTPQDVVVGTGLLPPVTSRPASLDRSSRRHGIVGIEQLYKTEHLHIAPSWSPGNIEPARTDRMSRHIVAYPPFSRREEREGIRAEVPTRFANAETLPPAPSPVLTNTLVEQETPTILHEALVAEPLKLQQPNRNSGSSYVPPIHMRRDQVYQHQYRQGSIRTDSVTDSDNGEAPNRRARKYTVVNQTKQTPRNCDTDTESHTTESPDRPASQYIALERNSGLCCVLSDCDTDTDSNTTEKRNRRGVVHIALGQNDRPRLVLSDCDTESKAGSDITELPDKRGPEYTAPRRTNTPRSPLSNHDTDVATTQAPKIGNKVPINSLLLLKKSSKDLLKSSHHLSTWKQPKILPDITTSGRSRLRKAKSWLAEKIQGRNEPPLSAEEAAKERDEAEKAAAAKEWAKERIAFDRVQADIARATFALEQAASEAALKKMGPGAMPGCCDPKCKLRCCRKGR